MTDKAKAKAAIVALGTQMGSFEAWRIEQDSKERKRGELCGNCEHFFKVYPDLAFGGCHLLPHQTIDFDSLCSINKFVRRGKP